MSSIESHSSSDESTCKKKVGRKPLSPEEKKQRYEVHKQKMIEANRKKWSENHEEMLQKRREYYQTHKTKIIEHNKKYRERHREYVQKLEDKLLKIQPLIS